MTRPGLISVPLLLTLVIALAAPASGSGSSLNAPAFKRCGSLPELTTWQIEAKGIRCKPAREIVYAYVKAGLEEGDSRGEYAGFRCRPSGTYGDGGLYRCSAKGPKGHRVIKFARGG